MTGCVCCTSYPCFWEEVKYLLMAQAYSWSVPRTIGL
jgi:hypothetical protein